MTVTRRGVLQTMLVGVTATDPLTFTSIAALFVAVARSVPAPAPAPASPFTFWIVSALPVLN